jgi:hypothetical protein
MNIYELEKLATPGPWRAHEWDEQRRPHIQGTHIDGMDRKCILQTEVWATRSGDHLQVVEIAKANIALTTHCVNNFDKALEALKEMRETIVALTPSEHDLAPGSMEHWNKLITELEEVK